MAKSKVSMARRARQIISSQSQSQPQTEEGGDESSDKKRRGARPNADADAEEEDEDFSTQGFVEGDSEDKLWSVIEILDERNGTFLVKWAGVDDNGHPWKDSWEPRENLTNDLVEEWREKKAAQKKEKRKKKQLNASKRSRTSSGISSSAAKPSSSSTTVASTSAIVKDKKSRRPSETPSAVVSIARRSKRKHNSASVVGDTDSDDEPPLKRQKSTSIDSAPASDRSNAAKEKKGKGKQKASSVDTPYSPPSSRLRKRMSDVVYVQKKVTTPPLSQDRHLSLNGKGKQAETYEDPFDHLSSSSLNQRIFSAGNRERDDFVSTSIKTSTLISNGGKKGTRNASRSGSESSSASRKSRKAANSAPIDDLETSANAPVAQNGTLDPDSPKRSRSNLKMDGGTYAAVPGKQYNRDPTPPRKSFKTSNATSPQKIKPVQSNFSHGSRVLSRVSSLRPDTDTGPRSMPENDEAKEEESIKDEVIPETLMDSAYANRTESRADYFILPQPKSPKERSRSYTNSSTCRSDEEAAVDFDLMGDAEDYAPEPQSREPLFLPETQDEQMDEIKNNGNETQTFSERLRSNSHEIIVPSSLSESQSQSQSGPHRDSQLQEHSGGMIDPSSESILAQFGSSLSADERQIAQVLQPAISPHLPATPLVTLETSLSPDLSDEPRIAKKKVLKKLPQISPSKFVPFLPARHVRLSALPAPSISGALNDATVPTSSIEMSQESPRDRARRRTSGRSANDEVFAVEGDSDIDTSVRHSLEQKQDVLRSVENMRQKELGKRDKQAPKEHLRSLLEALAEQSSPSEIIDLRVERPTLTLEGKDGEHVVTAQSTMTPYSLPLPFPPSERPGPHRASTPPEDRCVRQFEQDFLNLYGDDYYQKTGEGTYSDEPHKIALDDPIDDPECVDTFQSSGAEAKSKSQFNDDDDIEDEEVIAETVSEGGQGGSDTTSSHPGYDDETFYPQLRIAGSPKKYDTPTSPLTQTPTQALVRMTEYLRKKSESIDRLQEELASSERERLIQGSRLADIAAEKAVLERTLRDRDELAALHGSSTGVDDGMKDALASVTMEKEALVAEVALLKSSKEDLAKTLEIFREIYSKASSHTDEVQRELTEYKERATLAESQLSNGVALVRRAAQSAEEKLTSELNRVKGQLHILSMRDNRTDDEVRRRAAVWPELRATISRLQSELEDSRGTIDRIVHQRDDLLVSNRDLQEQLNNFRLSQEDRERLSENRIMELEGQVAWLEARERVVRCAFVDNHSAANEDAMVFVCEWMIHGQQCGAIFETVQELQDHVLTAYSHVRSPNLQP